MIPWQNWEEGGRQEGEGAVRRRKKLSKAEKEPDFFVVVGFVGGWAGGQNSARVVTSLQLVNAMKQNIT